MGATTSGLEPARAAHSYKSTYLEMNINYSYIYPVAFGSIECSFEFVLQGVLQGNPPIRISDKRLWCRFEMIKF